jgi:ubiquinone/menaquinone biosynthesis C-methylase UbiE
METIGTMNGLAWAGHPIRSRLNAWFFRAMDGYMHRKYDWIKSELFGGLPRVVVEIGAGGGANLRYLRAGSHVVALEPNVHMHPFLRAAAERAGVTVDVHAVGAERIPLADASVEAVISSLVLCSVSDPRRVLAEIRRVLRPGGRFWCLEHVAAPPGSALGRVQRAVRSPWRWLFEGCETQRDVAALLSEAGFASVEVEAFSVRTAFLPVRPHVAAVALR